MRARLGRYVAIGTGVLLLAACSSQTQPDLLQFPKSGRGPDEFSIQLTKPLQTPASYSALPAPTPGGTNITDPTPRADAVAALGGRASATGGGIPASDGRLVTFASRYGVAGNIRQQLAAEDLAFRRVNNGRPLERLAKVNVYFDSYARMSLDQHRELARWRKAGARTPSAPPRLPGE